MVKKSLFCVLLTLFAANSYAVTFLGSHSIVQENDQYIGVDEKTLGGMTEDEFNFALDRVEDLYRPIVEAKDAELSLERNWDDGTVNAYASRSGSNWTVAMFGGLARHEAVTVDGFTLVACHEFGHQVGGAPYKTSWWAGTSWAAAEGQADYYGAFKCLGKVFDRDDNVAAIENLDVPATVTNKCKSVWNTDDKVAKCARIAMAGLSLAKLFEDLMDLPKPISFDTPDTEVVSSTNLAGYPSVQCRLDTYLAGALCEKSFNTEPKDGDIDYSFCSRAEGNEIGSRPTCWYKP